MKLHSNIITKDVLYTVARKVREEHGQDIYVDEAITNGSRSRKFGVTFYCVSMNGRRSTNRRGVDGDARAASWSAYGYLLAELFKIDADMICDYYSSRDDFVRQCAEAYWRTDDEKLFLSVLGVKRIETYIRANSSVNGNPAWHVSFTDGTQARTSSDSSVSYEIGNQNMREGSPVEVHYTRSGRITWMKGF